MGIRLRIAGLSDGGPGMSSGINTGDILCFYGGAEISNMPSLQEAMRSCLNAGKIRVTLQLWRDGDLVELEAPSGPLKVELRETHWLEEQERQLAFMLTQRSCPNQTLPERLREFVGKEVEINVDDPTRTSKAKLMAVAGDHFAVMFSGSIYRYPFHQVLSLVETLNGGMVILVFHLVVYKGAIGIGFSIPLDS